MTSTIKHIKDNAEYVTLDSTTEVKNVQQFFNEVGDWALKTNGLPIATNTLQGIRRLATQEEVDSGLTDNIVTPKTLAFRLKNPQATEEVLGYVRYTKDSEALSFNNLTGVTPKTVKYIFDNYNATETQTGTTKIASTPQAVSGTLDNVVITPLKLKQAIAAMVPGYGTASESVLGITKMATVSQVRTGVIREGFSISPYTFANLNGSEADIGVFKVAKQMDMSGVSDSLVITPKKLNSYKASESGFGIVKLTSDVNNTDANTALKPTNNIMTKAGGVFIGDVYKTTNSTNNKILISSEVDDKITITKSELTNYINTQIDNVINTKLLGVNQTYKTFNRFERDVNKTYVNNTGKPILVTINVVCYDPYLALHVDGESVDSNYEGIYGFGGGVYMSMQAIVPNNSSYSLVGTIYRNHLEYWRELR